MKFSIIIACYNLGELVCQAIESSIKQEGISKDEYEILVINDGSTDNTLEFIKRYEKEDNLSILNKSNGGLSQTRNIGITRAKGDCVLFLDGDDWLAHNALETLKPLVGKYDIVDFPMIYYFDENDQRPQEIGIKEGACNIKDYLRQSFGKTRFDVIPAPKKMYNRSFINDNNIRFMEGILHEDGPFFIDVMNCCKSLFVLNKPLYFYRQNRDGSITSQQTRRNYEGIMEGIKHVEGLPIANNPDVCLRSAHAIVYQVTQKYKNEEDYRFVCHELRRRFNKRRLFKYLLKERFELKHTIRMLLLLIDPTLLGYIYK